MNTLIILSVCLTLVHSDTKDTAAVSAMFLSLIPPGGTFVLDTDPNLKSSKNVGGFAENKWNAENEGGTDYRVERSSLLEDMNKTKKSQDEEETTTVTTTATRKFVVIDYASKLRLAYLECIEETFVEVRRVIQFKAGSWEEHPTLSEWALCVLSKINLMSLQGVYRYDTAMSRINFDDKDEVDKILDRCLDAKPFPPQMIAWRYLKCIQREDRKKQYPSLSIFYTL